MKFVEEVIELVNKITNVAERDIHIKEISRKYGISEDAIKLEVEKKQKNIQTSGITAESFLENVKKERLQRLMGVQNKCSFNESSKYKDKIVRVLVEGPSKKNKEVLSGRTSTNKIVLFKGDMNLKGQFVNVKINECKTWTLYGELV